MAHRRAPLGLIAGIALAAAWLIAPATVAGGDPCYHGFELPARTTEATTQVQVAPCAFGPTNARIPVGGTVTFVNGPDVVHLITGANQEWGSRDTELRPAAKVSYTFGKAGIYPYACALHRGMSGAIVVGDATEGGPAAPVASTTAPPAAGGTSDGSVAMLLAGAAIGGVLACGVLLIFGAGRRTPVAIEPAAQPTTTEPAPR